MKSNPITLIFVVIVYVVLNNQFIYPQNNKIRVALEIEVDSKSSSYIEERLTSFLKRELRSLNDVEIVETNENIKLSIMAMENLSRTGEYKYGFTLSVISLYPMKCNSIFAYSFWGSTMFTSSEDALSSTSENIVAWFDHNSIEIMRNYYKKDK